MDAVKSKLALVALSVKAGIAEVDTFTALQKYPWLRHPEFVGIFLSVIFIIFTMNMPQPCPVGNCIT